jgi:hypothetical protein
MAYKYAPRDRIERRPCGNRHERDASKEENGDQGSGRKTERIVAHPVTFERVVHFEFHDGHTGASGCKIIAKIISNGLVDLVDQNAS